MWSWAVLELIPAVRPSLSTAGACGLGAEAGVPRENPNLSQNRSGDLTMFPTASGNVPQTAESCC